MAGCCGLGKGGRMRWWLLLLLGLGVGLVVVWSLDRGPAGEGVEVISLEALRAEVIPQAGADTTYGIPLSWDNAQQFADWYYQYPLTREEETVLREALGGIPTPCCDDTRLTRCCCERSGLICNLVRSARGLAAWLIRVQGFSATQVRAAVEEWVRFAHPDYYLAQALRARGASPTQYGFPTQGTCYRGECELPWSRGGCGGMGQQVKI